ncbi:MAG: type II secretion system F family protein [Clostridia bacterium]
MPHFNYQVIDNAGANMSGRVLADNKGDAYNKLRALGFVITSLNEHKTGGSSQVVVGKKLIKMDTLIVFSKQLSALLKSGIAITKALSSLIQQMEDKYFANILLLVVNDVEKGIPLSQALRKYAKTAVSEQVYSLIDVGELTGNLDTTFEKLSFQLQKEKIINETVKQAVFYPKMVLGFTGVVFFGLVIFIVPIFQNMIPASVALPDITKFVFALSASLKSSWYIYIIVAVAFYVGVLKIFPKSAYGKVIWEKLKFSVPVLGNLVKKSSLAKFARIASTLLECGVQVIAAFQSAGRAAGSSLITDSIEEATKQISQGSSIFSTLEKYPNIYPQLMVQMIEIGETSGSLPWMLDRVAEFYEEEATTATKKLTSVIEPVMLVLIAFVVGGMLISLYLPMFTMITSFTK